MEKDGSKPVRGEGSGGFDWINILPNSLLCEVLLNLPTKDVVKTSVLSSRWRNVWKDVPGLDLDFDDFADGEQFSSFVERFLGFNSKNCLQKVELIVRYEEDKGFKIPDIRRSVDYIFNRKVTMLHVSDFSEYCDIWDLEMPLTLCTCESLVSLKLSYVTLNSPKCLSLPCLKDMDLILVKFVDDLVFEKLISSCSAIENLYVDRDFGDNIKVLSVSSQSLLRFTHVLDNAYDYEYDLAVKIDAPKLEYLKLEDIRSSYILKNTVSLVKADIDIKFNLFDGMKFDPNDLPKRHMIRDFLDGISSVKHLNFSRNTLMVINKYSRCEPLPLFRNLSFLRVELNGYKWEMLPFFLEICPNLKSLVLSIYWYPRKRNKGINTVYEHPRCLLSSLEYVEIRNGAAEKMKLVKYFLDNSPILKKLTLSLYDSIENQESVFLRELITIPRLSPSCEVVIL